MINNLILASGEGLRLRKYFYKPKPFIRIDNTLSIIKSSSNFVKKYKSYFVILSKFKKYEEEILELKKIKSSKIFFIKKRLKGQAKTAHNAPSKLPLNIFYNICPCDTLIKFNFKEYEKTLMNYDYIIFLLNPSKIHLNNEKNYGWVKINKKNEIESISCKSKNKGVLKNQKIISGFFTIKNTKKNQSYFKKFLSSKKNKINNEYYLDSFFEYLHNNNEKIKFIIVKNYKQYGNINEINISKIKAKD